jgi:hypothetical protein
MSDRDWNGEMLAIQRTTTKMYLRVATKRVVAVTFECVRYALDSGRAAR